MLTYTLTDVGGGVDGDSASFSIDWATGQIMTKDALDEETGAEYTVVVRATDPTGIPQVQTAVETDSDEITVTITISDVNEPPAVTGNATSTFDETDGNIATPLNTYTAADPENDTPITWSVSGTDSSKFEISAVGALTFKAKPDFEAPTDANGDNVYEVTVVATAAGKAGTMDVKVTVENADEDGTVTLNRTRPRVGVAVMASLTDPDGGISGLTWQWSIDGATGQGSTLDGDIEDATADTYIPKAGDVSGALTATASYTDGEDSGKTAFLASAAVVADTRNKAPAFVDQDTETDGLQNESTERKVAEDTKALSGADNDDASGATDDAADNVGMAVTANDPDPNEDPLIYTLGGPDADLFRVRDNGQIEVGAGTELDYETRQTYMVMVIAEDSFGATASIEVTIKVTPIDEQPEITGDDSSEYAEDRMNAVETYTAEDPEGATISWSLSGTDADAFKIVGGVLTFAKQPDYESPVDVEGTSPSTAAAGDNMYEVTVQATDETMKVGTKVVTVEVTNVDEPGKVTLSALKPQVATTLTATPSDPDGDLSDPKWQWSKSMSRNGSYADIEDANASTYTPKTDDTSYYLMAQVTYEDPEGADKTAMEKTANTVQSVRSPNNAPEFPDQDAETPGDQSATATRKVAENTPAGQTVGDPVTANDQDGDVLTYTLTDVGGGVDGDSASFSIDWATGQIMTKDALDEETGAEYTVVVRATDPTGIPQVQTAVETDSDEITVTITISDVNEPPAVTGNATSTFDETDGNIATPLNTYTAADPENDTPITWSVSGTDSSKFEISAVGALTFKAKPDFEAPTDANGDNVYEVTVVATAAGKAGTMDVKVTVENADEDGTVTLNRTRPRVGVAVMASLTDPDGGISGLTWQWSIDGATGQGSTLDGDIEDATADTYIPKAGDVSGALTATASYTDGEDSGKTAFLASAAVVADTRNKAPAFVDQDTETDGLQNESTERKVAEDTKALSGADNDDASGATDDAADNVGMAVTANDPDPNEDPLIYTLGGPDADLFRVRDNGQIEVGAGTELDYETRQTYMVMVIAEDSFGATASIEVTIKVTNVDEAPEITVGAATNVNEAPVAPTVANQTATEDTAFSYTVPAFTDPEGGMITYTATLSDDSALPGWLSFNASTRELSGTPLEADTPASLTIKVSATDDGSPSASAEVTFTLTVGEEAPTVNEAPVAPTVANQTATEDTAFSYTVPAFTDPEGGMITYTATLSDDSALPGWLSFNASTRELSGTPLEADTPASLTIKVSATDDGSPSASAEVTFTLTVGEEAPTTLLDRYDASEDGWIQLKEARVAVGDYFGPPKGVNLSLADTRKVVGLYFEYKNRQ